MIMKSNWVDWFQTVEKGGLLAFVEAANHLQKDILQCAVANRPFEVYVLFFQLPEVLQDVRNFNFWNVELDKSTDLFADSCRVEDSQHLFL